MQRKAGWCLPAAAPMHRCCCQGDGRWACQRPRFLSVVFDAPGMCFSMGYWVVLGLMFQRAIICFIFSLSRCHLLAVKPYKLGRVHSTAGVCCNTGQGGVCERQPQCTAAAAGRTAGGLEQCDDCYTLLLLIRTIATCGMLNTSSSVRCITL
jgi:hypothetical protein